MAKFSKTYQSAEFSQDHFYLLSPQIVILIAGNFRDLQSK